jgi:methyl-accepting chemotaxis protein
MGTFKVWQKLTVIVLILLLPLSVVGSWMLLTEYTRLKTEQKRLAGLEYVHHLRQLLEHLQRHRTASIALLSGARVATGPEADEQRKKAEKERKDYEDELEKAREQLQTDVDNINRQEARDGRRLKTGAAWEETQDSWELVRRYHSFQSPADSNQMHARLIDQILQQIAATADSAQLLFVGEGSRYYLYETLALKLPAQIEVLTQLQTEITGIARRRELSLPERAGLLGRKGQIEVLAAAVKQNIAGAYRYSSRLDDEVETLEFKNHTACEEVLGQIDTAFLQPGRIDVLPDTVFTVVGKSIGAAFGLYDKTHDVVRTLTEHEVARAQRRLAFAAGSLLGSLMIGMGVVVLLSHGITRQVYAITHTFGQVEQGNYSARARIVIHDELGTMAGSLNRMLDNTLALIQSREERDRIQRAIAKLLDDVHGVASGDLTCQAVVGSDVTGPIAESVNFMIGQLRRVISRVQGASVQVSASTNALQSVTGELSRGAEIQAEQTSQATAGIARMADSTQQVSQAAAVSAQVGQQALASARKGNLAVKETVQGMNRLRDQVREVSRGIQQLGDTAREIGPVVALVDDLAEWASILALNASMQAAQPGEAGRRYAVIAEVAGRLADRSREGAKRVAALTSLQAEAARTVAALEESARESIDTSLIATQAGQALAEIESVSQRLAELIASIARVAEQQARGSEVLSRSMQEISNVTRKTARGTKETAAAIGALARLADELHGSVSTFRIPADSSSHAQNSIFDLDHEREGGFHSLEHWNQPLDATPLDGNGASRGGSRPSPDNATIANG